MRWTYNVSFKAVLRVQVLINKVWFTLKLILAHILIQERKVNNDQQPQRSNIYTEIQMINEHKYTKSWGKSIL